MWGSVGGMGGGGTIVRRPRKGRCAAKLPPHRTALHFAQVKKAAWVSMSAAFKLNGNRDIEPVVPAMLSCIARPAEVGDTITKLSATTFVQVWGRGVGNGVWGGVGGSEGCAARPVEVGDTIAKLSATTFVQV